MVFQVWPHGSIAASGKGYGVAGRPVLMKYAECIADPQLRRTPTRILPELWSPPEVKLLHCQAQIKELPHEPSAQAAQ
jgi:hypothetical protein